MILKNPIRPLEKRTRKISEPVKSYSMEHPEKNNPNGKRPTPLTISTTLAERPLLVKLVERLACRNYDCDQRFEKVPAGSVAIETSSLEAFVSGDLNLSSPVELINQSFITSFLFTCIRMKGQNYDLKWISSLS